MPGSRAAGTPRLGRSLLTRRRLLAMLGDRFERRLVLIVAGAGFGKSCLIAQAMNENRLDPRGLDVFVECVPSDAAASQLAARLLAAMGADTPTEPAGIMDQVSAVCAAVWQRAPSEVALVMDDVQVLSRGSSGADLLVELVRTLPSNGHVVLAGRVEPPVAWARLAAMGEVREIREPDLILTDEELAELARLRDVPELLLAGVGGWPALAELTVNAGQARVAEYLWEELLCELPDNDRRLLAAIACVGGADDQVAAALAGRPVSLRPVVSALPLVSLDDAGWCRLHGLWWSALASALTADDVVQARRAAARVLAGRGEVAPAGRLLVEAGAWDELDDLVVGTCQLSYLPVGTDVLGEWLQRMPAPRRSGPAALLVEGILRRATDADAAQLLLLRASHAFHGADDVRGEIGCITHLATIAWRRRDRAMIARVLPVAEALARRAAPGPLRDGVEAVSGFVRLADADLRGDLDGMQRLLESITVSKLSPEWQATFLDWCALTCLVRGDAATALDLSERALALAARGARQAAVAIVLLCLQVTGRQDDVLRRLPEAFAGFEGASENRVSAHALAAAVLGWSGMADRAAYELRQAEAVAGVPCPPFIEVSLTRARLALALVMGEPDPAGLAARLVHLCHGASGRADWQDVECLARLVDQLCLAVEYVLMPSERSWWEAQPLQGCFAQARDAARALVALRQGASPDATTLPALAILRTFLPPGWVNELLLGTGEGAIPSVEGIVASDPSQFEVQLLGPLRVVRDRAAVTDPRLRRERVRELLAYLVLHDAPSRQRIGAELWPHLDPEAGARNLRVTLTYLSHVLQPAAPVGARLVVLRAVAGRIELIRSPLFRTDVWMVEELLDEAAVAERQHVPSLALARYQEALQHWRGPLLADSRGPEWLLPHRDRLERRLVAAAVRAGDLLVADRDFERALGWARRALSADPESETAHQVLVSAHLAAGDLAAARVAFDDCRRMLAALGAGPQARTLMLGRRIHGHQADPVPACPPSSRQDRHSL